MTPLPKRRHSTRRKGARRRSITLPALRNLQLVKIGGKLIPHSLVKQQKQNTVQPVK